MSSTHPCPVSDCSSPSGPFLALYADVAHSLEPLLVSFVPESSVSVWPGKGRFKECVNDQMETV